MITLMFTCDDLEEGAKEYYHDVIISKEDMSEAHISEVCSLFKSLLVGMGYSETLADQYILDEPVSCCGGACCGNENT